MRPVLALLLACSGGTEAPDQRRLVEARSEEIDLLEALGYVEGTVDPDAEKRGVLEHDPALSSPGLSLYASRTSESAQLIDLDGRVMHEWARDTPAPWQHVHLDPDTGDLLVLMKDVGLWKLDVDGDVVWKVDGRFHHDLWWADDGRIHVLSRRAVSMPDWHAELEILEDTVTVLSPDGRVVDEWSVLDAVASSAHAYLLPDLGDVQAKPGGTADIDILHTNHIELLPAGAGGRFSAGDVLLSSRNINAVFVLDAATRDVKWIWGPGNVLFQHHPVFLDSGNVLLFDNGRKKRSRVLEVDPTTQRIVWRYDGPPRFYSKTRGSVQRLDNGNTLITISDSGYVREVTADGDVAWSFANPDVDETGMRGAIWRMTRYPPGSLSFMDGTSGREDGRSR